MDKRSSKLAPQISVPFCPHPEQPPPDSWVRGGNGHPLLQLPANKQANNPDPAPSVRLKQPTSDRAGTRVDRMALFQLPQLAQALTSSTDQPRLAGVCVGGSAPRIFFSSFTLGAMRVLCTHTKVRRQLKGQRPCAVCPAQSNGDAARGAPLRPSAALE